MALYTYEEAKQHYEEWLAADLALATSQSYSIAGRSLTRANLADVRERIAYWRQQMNDAMNEQQGRPRSRRTAQYIPFDQ